LIKSNINISMRILVIFINFLLITLILYNIMNSKLVEGLSGCSGTNKNAIYRQQALTNRLFSQMNTLKAEYKELDNKRKTNSSLIAVNKAGSRSAVSNMNDKRKEKEKELDDLEKENQQDEQPGALPMPTGDGGSGGFASRMKSSATQARF